MARREESQRALSFESSVITAPPGFTERISFPLSSKEFAFGTAETVLLLKKWGFSFPHFIHIFNKHYWKQVDIGLSQGS